MRLARTILEAAVADSTLVIHRDDRSTDFLKAIYAGKGYPVISGNVNRQDLLEAIKRHSRVFMLGHGVPTGLIGPGYVIDRSFGPALAEKQDGLYVWCNADAYAKANKLTGLVSGMFISEVGEARMFGIKAMQEEVDASNAAFSKAVRAMLDTGAPLASVRQGYTHATCKITRYNNERLYVFDNGNPTPALHSSSLAHREEQPQNFSAGQFSRYDGAQASNYDAYRVRDIDQEDVYDISFAEWSEELSALLRESPYEERVLEITEGPERSNWVGAIVFNCWVDGFSPAEALEKVLCAMELGGSEEPERQDSSQHDGR